MSPLLAHKLLVVTGKGGAGKTTIAGAIGLLAASHGLRTIVVEVGEQDRLGELYGLAHTLAGVERALEENLWSITIDPDRALLEWLQLLGGRVSGRILATSSTFQYFAAAAPGARELVSMIKVWELAQGSRRAAAYDLVVLDAPASGHALGMLQSPATFGAIARVGTVARQTQRVSELLADPARSAYLAVAQPAEMAVTETLELADGLRRAVARELAAVVVNGVLPRRFSAAELERLAQAARAGNPAAAAAARAARAVHERARVQRKQLTRLRRRQLELLTVPFQFRAELDLTAIRVIARQLERQLERSSR
jgi:anion-transporting  ArsA/GET3 family ATPase